MVPALTNRDCLGKDIKMRRTLSLYLESMGPSSVRLLMMTTAICKMVAQCHVRVVFAIPYVDVEITFREENIFAQTHT